MMYICVSLRWVWHTKYRCGGVVGGLNTRVDVHVVDLCVYMYVHHDVYVCILYFMNAAHDCTAIQYILV